MYIFGKCTGFSLEGCRQFSETRVKTRNSDVSVAWKLGDW